MTIPQNFDNPSPLASLDPSRWKEAQARRQDDEEREERRERFEPPGEYQPPTRQPILELSRLQIDRAHIVWYLGLMTAWESEKGKEVKAALRGILVEVEKQIKQEKDDATQ